jgi:hypothetical protein
LRSATAQDKGARDLAMARHQIAELEARALQLQAELEKERAIAAQWKAKCEAFSAESAQLRAQLLLSQAEREKGLRSLVETTDTLKKVRAENQQLQAERKQLYDLAAKAGILPKSSETPDSAEQTSAPKTAKEGKVVEVRDDGSVVVSLGANDGLRTGDQLHIYRDLGDHGIYVGKIEIVESRASSATCKILSRQDTPSEGDRVVTRL